MDYGFNTCFYADIWVRSTTPKDIVPRVFSISEQKEWLMGYIGLWEDDVLVWNTRWRRTFFLYELGSDCKICYAIQGMSISLDRDRWWWSHARDGQFSGASYFSTQLECYIPTSSSSTYEDLIVPLIWVRWVPSKVVVLSC